MKDKLYEWYIENRRQEMNERRLNEAFEIMLQREKKLIPYIQDFQVVESDESFLGKYANEAKVIRINKKQLSSLKENSQIIYGMEVIKHEMEHARSIKVLEEGHDDIESLITNYSLKDYAIKHGLDWHSNLDQLNPLYLRFRIHENYQTDPGERLADIKAWKYIVNLLKNQRVSDDLLLARKNLYYAYIRGYQDNRYYLEAPTLDFLLKTRMLHEFYWLKNRIEDKDYCFQTRLMYGLPLTTEEYQEKTLQKVKLKKVRKDY